MFLSDQQISSLQSAKDIFSPYFGEKLRTNSFGHPAVSYGLSQVGYDVTLSPQKLLIFTPPEDHEVFLCPKLGDRLLPQEAVYHQSDDGGFFWLPPRCAALGASVELISMPNNVVGLIFGKSTYTRLGIIVNASPIEPGWAGHLTLSIVNPSPMYCKLWAGEGIAQVMLSEIEEVGKPYDGKYQYQGNEPVQSKVG